MILLLMATSCSQKQNPVPYTSINFQVCVCYYPSLNTPGNWSYFTGGPNGVIIYNTGNGANPFVAYDRTCTYDPAKGYIQVNPSGQKEANIWATCTQCRSMFNLYSGTGIPTAGPATISLKQYTTSFDGQYITVSN